MRIRCTDATETNELAAVDPEQLGARIGIALLLDELVQTRQRSAQLEHVRVGLVVVGEEGLEIMAQIRRAGEGLQVAELRSIVDLDHAGIRAETLPEVEQQPYEISVATFCHLGLQPLVGDGGHDGSVQARVQALRAVRALPKLPDAHAWLPFCSVAVGDGILRIRDEICDALRRPETRT